MQPHRQWNSQILFIIAIIALCVILAGFIFIGYHFVWTWTGFNAFTGPQVLQYQPTKTLWDWMQLLIIPFVLAGGAILFNFVVNRNEQRATQIRDQTERAIALDSQRETELQSYLDKMSELLLERNLRKSSIGDEVRDIARARTVTILRGLDADRKASVLQFLYESSLIDIIDLHEANLSDVKLVTARLHNASLNRANLSRAILSRAILSKSSLQAANLRNADLSLSDLTQADLQGAILKDTHIGGATLKGTKLSTADLSGANLSGADLSESDLSRANLSGADLRACDLSGANLSRANLSRANLSNANLNAAVLRGAIYSPIQLKTAISYDNIIT